MRKINFQLGTVAVPVLAAGTEIKQNYSPLGGRALIRTLNGTGVRQSHWRKTKIVTTGTGWIPAGLQELNYDQSMVLKCSAARQQQSGSNVFALPTTRRSDVGFTPLGAALVNDSWVESSVVVVVNTATVQIVPSATGYRVVWFPEFTVHADPPTEDNDLAEATFSWTLTAEEV